MVYRSNAEEYRLRKLKKWLFRDALRTALLAVTALAAAAFLLMGAAADSMELGPLAAGLFGSLAVAAAGGMAYRFIYGGQTGDGKWKRQA